MNATVRKRAYTEKVEGSNKKVWKEVCVLARVGLLGKRPKFIKKGTAEAISVVHEKVHWSY